MAKSTKSEGAKLGLLGSGTVGEALQEFLFEDSEKRDGKAPGLDLVKIYTRHPEKKKWYSSHPKLFTTKPEEVIDHPEIDIVIEALGFQQEKDLVNFKDYIIRAFRKGKSVVTSDKAVLAAFGKEIWAAAKEHGQELRFEACVGGGIPIIRSLTQSFAGERPEAIYGIVNGTCNYILSEMKRSAKSYEDALKEAQQRGYAETNPKSDVSGSDAESKLILLSAVTFGLHVKPGRILRKGIEQIHAVDFLYAGRKGSCTIKHMAVARRNGDAVRAFVSPMLVPVDHFLASIDGATNAIFFKGRRSGEQPVEGPPDSKDWNYAFVGPGAGGGPTAIAILGDVGELARGRSGRSSEFRGLVASGTLELESEDGIESCFYIRFIVKDRAGIVGDIGQAFGDAGINISEIWQLSHSHAELEALAKCYHLSQRAGEILPFVISLEHTTVGRLREALKTISRKDYVLADPVWLPIWSKN